MSAITVLVTDSSIDVAALQKLADAQSGPRVVLVTEHASASQDLAAAIAHQALKTIEPADPEEPLWIRINQQPSSPWNKKPRR